MNDYDDEDYHCSISRSLPFSSNDSYNDKYLNYNRTWIPQDTNELIFLFCYHHFQHRSSLLFHSFHSYFRDVNFNSQL
ncbi:hypothetical protein DERP_006803 [Dermatophagoides pteronyssinus]|uniref:Uncharacterized protein n=1 Tax=Dermatophagoides pteronyssinus TaxID=6956 RepID=A0ABQ8ISA5_DERPT|nr:hypothetical protein DERP_006803 [Dermatophagoides pteronyssinus]